MATKLYVTHCCAVGEIDDLSKSDTPEAALKTLYPTLLKGLPPLDREYFGPHRLPIIIFTGVTTRVLADHASGRRDDYGQAFSDYLRDNGLGKVVRTDEVQNWTDNKVRLWAWTVDYEALEKWGSKHMKEAA